MTERTAAELEMDAEAARERVADTAESIRSKMTPGQLIDEFTGLFTGGDGAAALTNLKTQIRDNPLPLTMVGAGLAWLMLGEGASGSSAAAARESRSPRDNGGSPFRSADARREFGDYGSSVGSISDEPTASTPTGAMDSLTSVAEGAVDAVKGAVGTAKDAVGNVSDRVMGATADMGSAAGDMGQRARQTAQDMFQREPLVIAALGLAVGTAIGAMLPSTTLEDEQLGRYGDKLRDTAEDLMEKGVEGAKEVAAETYETIKEEADHHGLSGSGETSVVEQVGEVVKSAAAKTEKTVRARIAPKRGE